MIRPLVPPAAQTARRAQYAGAGGLRGGAVPPRPVEVSAATSSSSSLLIHVRVADPGRHRTGGRRFPAPVSVKRSNPIA